MGPEEIVSTEYVCPEGNWDCNANLAYNHNKSRIHKIIPELKESLDSFTKMLNQLNVHHDVSFSDVVSIFGFIVCHSKPGHTAWVGFSPKILRVKGQLTKDCYSTLTGTRSPYVKRRVFATISEMPLVKDDGNEDGVLTCRTSSTESQFIKNGLSVDKSDEIE